MLLAIFATLIALVLLRRFLPAMLAFVLTRMLFAAALFCVVVPAFADTIALSPAVLFFGPAVSAVVYSVTAVVVGFVIAILQKYLTKLGINLTDDQYAVVKRTAAHWASQLWAKEDTSLATASITVADPRVAAYANFALNEIPVVAKALGLTPAKMSQFIVAAIGDLQAKATSVVVPANPPTAPAK